MKNSPSFLILLFACSVFGQGPTTFTYQGRLSDNGSLANGNYDLQFALYDALTAGNAMAGPVTNAAVTVSDGLFTTILDFGPGVFTTADRWLEMAVRTNGSSSPFITLTPRQLMTSVPRALYADAAGTANGVSASNIVGAIPDDRLSTNVALLTGNATFAGAVTATTFNGSGLGITSLPVDSLVRITTNSSIVGWGRTNFGLTTAPTNLTDALALSAGINHNLALKRDGTVAAWGITSATNVPPGLSNVIAISAGFDHSMALRVNGTIVAWGQNGSRQTNVPPSATNIVGIAAGGEFSLALRADGRVVAWGNNLTGQTNVPPGLSNVVAVAAGGFHGAALRSNGTVVVWGSNEAGQRDIPPGLTNVVTIASGWTHIFALRTDGRLVVWGGNSTGQTNVPANLSNVVAMAGGMEHSIALKSDGTVVAWGGNLRGQTNVPAGLNGVVAVASGSSPEHSLVLRNEVYSPVPWLDANNTFQGINTFGAVFARTFSGNGSALTNLNASNISSGTLADAHLSGNVTLLNSSPAFSGQVSAGAGMRLNDNDLWLRSSGSLNGLGWYGAGKLFAGVNVDGPVLFGSSGGALGQSTARGDTIALRWNGFDDVGIGRNSAANRLEVEGDASKTTSGNWLANSDARIKTRVRPVSGALEKLAQVRLVRFRYTDEYRAQHSCIEDREYLNVIAQEFQKVFPEHVKGSGEKLPNGDEILQVDTHPLTIYSAAAVQELNRVVQEKEARIAALESRLARLEASVATLTSGERKTE